MGQLHDRMERDLKLKGYAPNTQSSYLGCARRFAEYHGRSPETMGEEEVKAFLMHVVEERRGSPSTHRMYVAALKFLYKTTLGRPEVMEKVPFPKVSKKLPNVLSGSEVARLLGCITSIKYRTIASTSYGTGLRVGEACGLRPGDIDSTRGLIHVRAGKGNKDREVMLPKKLLEMLRRYWRITKPETEWLFPSNTDPRKPVDTQTLRRALHQAAQAARLKKHVTPHLLRHSFATHLLELGHDIHVVQALLGHASMETTRRYIRVRAEFIRTIQSPLDVAGTENSPLH